LPNAFHRSRLAVLDELRALPRRTGIMRALQFWTTDGPAALTRTGFPTMSTSRTWLERFNSRIRNNKVLAALIVIGSTVVGLSTFTNATRNLANLVHVESGRPAINGEWKADVTYDWPNAKFTESLSLSGDGEALHGSVSFLGVKRGILEGAVKGGGLEFSTRTQESSGPDVTHRYSGRIAADEIRFVMQTEGGTSAHEPVEFIARRATGALPKP
jgi:hypothetical protein